eukprot:TRINITY_DN53_c0_g1_i4.p1 TRINITY_DN53_c0_g1~~TRINITY_DN53_c0_g1_i4.p1  ORF type:complete len:172 (-),score=34.34 TRINITY_DN53_c0_g1_i4:175-690(-)
MYSLQVVLLFSFVVVSTFLTIEGQTANCTSGTCPNPPRACFKCCDGKQCGSDGCGGVCGTCGSNQFCNADGRCQALCKASCLNKECGDDGAGGYCGICPAGLVCSANRCKSPCVPSCLGKNCGSDGCGGVCGFCPHSVSCSAAGRCSSAAPAEKKCKSVRVNFELADIVAN